MFSGYVFWFSRSRTAYVLGSVAKQCTSTAGRADACRRSTDLNSTVEAIRPAAEEHALGSQAERNAQAAAWFLRRCPAAGKCNGRENGKSIWHTYPSLSVAHAGASIGVLQIRHCESNGPISKTSAAHCRTCGLGCVRARSRAVRLQHVLFTRRSRHSACAFAWLLKGEDWDGRATADLQPGMVVNGSGRVGRAFLATSSFPALLFSPDTADD